MRSAIVCLIVATAQGTEARGLEAVTACSDACGPGHASNGLCEDGGPGSVWPDCSLGTDCSDCGVREYPSPPPAPANSPAPSPAPSSGPFAADWGCSDACGPGHASNGLCEDGGPGSVWPDCPLGTDCSDCGPRPPLDAAAFPDVIQIAALLVALAGTSVEVWAGARKLALGCERQSPTAFAVRSLLFNRRLSLPRFFFSDCALLRPRTCGHAVAGAMYPLLPGEGH